MRDPEPVALLVLSDADVGFLSDHYAEPRARRMRAVAPKLPNDRCTFSWMHRRATYARVVPAFRACLLEAHVTRA